MRRISLFAEDFGHEEVLRALLEERFAGEYSVDVEVKGYSVRGGYGAVEREFKRHIQELESYRAGLPDLVIVATDSNCAGYVERRKRMQHAAEPIRDSVAYAIPDPHVERWLLLDSAAFKSVLGKACRTPDLRCDRDRYKGLLVQAVRETGTTPLLGGMEHAREIVRHMDLARLQRADKSFGDLLEELHSRFRRWATT